MGDELTTRLRRLEEARQMYADEKDRQAAGEVVDDYLADAADALAAAALDVALAEDGA